MKDRDEAAGGKAPDKSERQRRLDARLRDNLKRRKEQARARRSGEDGSAAAGDPSGVASPEE